MDIDMTNGKNIFVDEITGNKMEFGEILMKEEIKEEFIEDQTTLLDENEGTLTPPNENSVANSSVETGVQNCIDEKIEYPSLNVIGLCLSQFTPEELLFDRRGNLEKNSRTVGKLFNCSVCPYQTPRVDALQRHKRTHTGEKPFKCSFCPYKTAESGNIQRHERTHTGEKPFKCPHCPYQSADGGNLKKHKRIHTGKKLFKCSSCPYQAARKETLQKHERTHTGEKPFKYSSCPYQAVQCSLQQHMEIHTNDATLGLMP